jgi:hypothetical protein
MDVEIIFNLAVHTPDDKLEAPGDIKWLNLISADGTEFAEKQLGTASSSGPTLPRQGNYEDLTVDRAIFAHSKKGNEKAMYRFAGVFRKTLTKDANGMTIYKRVAEILSVDDWQNAYKQYSP